MKKKPITILLLVCIICTLFPTPALAATVDGSNAEQFSQTLEQNPFNDVAESDWFFNGAQYARINGFFNGTDATTFSPKGTMTRGMFVTVLGRMASVDTGTYSGATGFSDIPETEYYAPYVAWASKHGITTGVGDGRFDPNGLINREQMATFFVRYFENFGVDYETDANITSTPADINTVASYSREPVLKLWKNGLLNGDGSNFNPKGNASRAEASVLCMRIDKAVKTWYKEPGVASDRVSVDPTESGTNSNGATDPGVTTDPNSGKPGVSGGSSGGGSTGGGSTSGGSTGGDENTSYTITFMDGSRQVEQMSVLKDQTLEKLPEESKTAKADAIFIGWYTDAELTKPFYKDSPVTENTTVYAAYSYLSGSNETVTITSFTKMDSEPNISFDVTGSGTPNEESFTLLSKDGSDPVKIAWQRNSDNSFRVYAPDGFNAGCSYELTLADGWNFKDKEATVRTVSFSIIMDEVQNLKMNDDVQYIRNDAPQALKAGDTISQSGIEEGTLLCFYKDTDPQLRDYSEDAYIQDPEIWFKAAGVSGNNVTLAELESEDQQNLYKLPDNFPIRVSGLPDADKGTVNISDLDEATYNMMLSNTSVQQMENDGDSVSDDVNEGDFITLFTDPDKIANEDDVYFGEVTSFDETTGEITYTKTTSDAISNSMDMYVSPELDGSDIVTSEEVVELQEEIQEQVEQSNFGEDAARMMLEMAVQTDGFSKMENLESMTMQVDGNSVSEDELRAMNLGGSFEMPNGVKVTVELITNGDQLHFGDGVQMAIGVDATFEKEVKDGGKIAIDLSATFVEEVAFAVDVRGELIKTKILGFIPVPKGVYVSSNIDIKNYTALSFNVNIYTVEKEEKGLWDQFKTLCSGDFENASMLPDSLRSGLKSIDDVLDKIDEIQSKIDQGKEAVDTVKGYVDDVNALWASIEDVAAGGQSPKVIVETLGKTNITNQLMDMMGMTTDTNLKTEYLDSMQAFVERYSELLQNESQWVKLVEQEMAEVEYCFYGIAVKAEADFVVRADLNIAMGANLEYEVGKRYSFWFKVGFMTPSGGNSSMDLVDERFAFQFYIMGRAGLKMGVAASINVGLGSTKLASVGIEAELGPYVKVYGFFLYEYEKQRPANTTDWIYDERMAGALYMDIGVYFILSFDAQALDETFEYSKDIVNTELPLLNVGKPRYQYNFAYQPEENEKLRVVDSDANSKNGISMEIPDSVLAMSYLDLDTGELGSESYALDNYSIRFSNAAFSQQGDNICVDVPDGAQYIESDMTLTYLGRKMSFSNWDMSVTVPLVWTNLTDAEINEYYTASVQVGDEGSYRTVWSQRVKKNEPFDLPEAAEIEKLIGYTGKDDLKYASVEGYTGVWEDLKIYSDTTYTFKATPKIYKITVDGIQNADGTTRSETFTAPYGKSFDFTSLSATGTDKTGASPDQNSFTKFISVNGEDIDDLNMPIDSVYAEKLNEGFTASAEYADDSVLVTYTFPGTDVPEYKERIRKGTSSTFDYGAAAAEYNVSVKSISPAAGKLASNTTYTVECSIPVKQTYTITFEENGGSEVMNVTREEGSTLPELPESEKAGFNFAGWYTDEQLTTLFTQAVMPDKDMTLYAKWTAGEYTVTFDVNGGNALDDNEKTVSFDSAYGTLPVPETDQGMSFAGWFTEADGNNIVTAETIVSKKENHTLYAHWTNKTVIAQDTVTCEEQSATFNTQPQEVTFACGEYDKNSFTVEYRKDGETEWQNQAINAGQYDVRISRVEDKENLYFEKTFAAVFTINKAQSEFLCDTNSIPYEMLGTNNLRITPLRPGVDYIGEGQVEYKLIDTLDSLDPSDWKDWQTEPFIRTIIKNSYSRKYFIAVRIPESDNYLACMPEYSHKVKTLFGALTTWELLDGVSTIPVKGDKDTLYQLNETNGYTFKVRIKTSNIKNAGTDANIYACLANESWVSSIQSGEYHLNKDGNDFEKGDTDVYDLKVREGCNLLNPTHFMLYFEKDGIAAGWHCEYVEVIMCKDGQEIETTGAIPVNRWFENTGANFGTDVQFKRVISWVDGLGDETIELTEDAHSDIAMFDFSEMKIYDQYRTEGYNPFMEYKIPELTMAPASEEDSAYAVCVETALDWASVDKEQLYELMKENGDESVRFAITFSFDDGITSDDTCVQTKYVTFTLAD